MRLLLVLRVLCEGGRLYYNQLHPPSRHCISLLGGRRTLAFLLKMRVETALTVSLRTCSGIFELGFKDCFS